MGPENILIFMIGPLTGTRAFFSDRFEVITISPLTGIYAEADYGGHWGEKLNKSGYDGIIVLGKAHRPLYIWIDNGQVRLKDDTLPSRILTHKRGGGTNHLPALNIMLNDYYKYRKWDEFGIPTKKKLKELGLDEF